MSSISALADVTSAHLLTDEEAVILLSGSNKAELSSFVLNQAIPPDHLR
jgi:hypothetical protein